MLDSLKAPFRGPVYLGFWCYFFLFRVTLFSSAAVEPEDEDDDHDRDQDDQDDQEDVSK